MPRIEPTAVSDAERRRRLVVVRAGDASLHPTWLQGPESPEFDLVVSYYGDDPSAHRSNVENRIDQKGGKWDGLAALFAARPDLLDAYDYFWLPDDDIAADSRTINGIFAAMAAHALELAQPSLTLDSYYTYITYLRCRGFALRYSTAIEIMAPCLSAGLLRRVLPLVANSPSGWGLDPVWTRMNADNRHKSAILDDWPVRHTRPLGGPLYHNMAKKGRSAWDDLATMRSHFGVSRLYPMIYAARDARGGAWGNQAALGLRMALAYLIDRRNIPHYDSARGNILTLTRRAFYHKADLRPVRTGQEF